MRCLRTKSDIWSLYVSLPSPISRTVYSVSVPFRLPHRFFFVQYSMFSLDFDASVMRVMRVMRALFIDSFIAVL